MMMMTRLLLRLVQESSIVKYERLLLLELLLLLPMYTKLLLNTRLLVRLLLLMRPLLLRLFVAGTPVPVPVHPSPRQLLRWVLFRGKAQSQAAAVVHRAICPHVPTHPLRLLLL